MSLENRPYIGTWSLNGKKVVHHTPDALVYINGQPTLPGCKSCSGRIDLQKYITEVTCEAGVEPGGTSASFSLSVPLNSADSFDRDSNYLIYVGLEVSIYQRGFFPVQGMYSNLAQKTISSSEIQSSKVNTKTKTIPPPQIEKILNDYYLPRGGGKLRDPQNKEKQETANLIYDRFRQEGYTPSFSLAMMIQASYESNLDRNAQNGNAAFGIFQLNVFGGAGNSNNDFKGGRKAGTTEQATNDPELYYDAFDINTSIDRQILSVKQSGKNRAGRNSSKTLRQSFEDIFWSPLGAGGRTANTPPHLIAEYEKRISKMEKSNVLKDFLDDVTFNQRILDSNAKSITITEDFVTADTSISAEIGPSLLESVGLENEGIEGLIAYPYYHVFHGVVTNVSHSYSGGFHNVTVQCASLLHFWETHKISANASVFGPRPTNSKLKVSLTGHNFAGMHPYAIIYQISHDMTGAAGGVAYNLSKSTNVDVTSEFSGESFFSMIQKYWERRFNSKMTRLRMHGFSGEIFSSAQSYFLSRNSPTEITRLVKQRFSDPTARGKVNDNILSAALSLGLFNKRRLEALVVNNKVSENSRVELNLAEMHAFVNNISEWGQVNFFESAYESKMDVVRKVCDVTGFEFYQDVDGDFVFKPPMYNLDTSASRIYRIEDIDIINFSRDASEPAYTYARGKSSIFQNLQGHGVENEWGVDGTYIDYRLVAQYGWKPLEFESAYYTNPKAIFYAGANKIDTANALIKKASVTIPLRPEIRPGYPVYIVSKDCFYYCTGVSHSFSVGGQCTTTLTLVGERSKFFAPGEPQKDGIDSIDLGDVILPPKPLEVLQKDGQTRLSGFPNVVLALDPFQINPLLFIFGNDFDEIDDPITLKNLLEMGVQKRILQRDGIYYVLEDSSGVKDESQKVLFALQEDVGSSKTGSNVVNINRAAKKYTTLQSKALSNRSQIEKNKKELINRRAEIVQKIQNLNKKEDEGNKDLSATISPLLNQVKDLDTKIDQLTKEANGQGKAFEQDLTQTEADGVNYLVILLRRLAQDHFMPLSGDGKSIEAHHLLDMLSDKKAIYTNGKLPGTFRYYSASHPDPSQQGQPLLEVIEDDNGKKTFSLKESLLEPRWKGQKVLGFKNSVTLPYPGARLPEAELGDLTPTRGIRVFTSNPEYPRGEVVPTSSIYSLSFGYVDTNRKRDVIDTRSKSSKEDLGQEAINAIMRKFVVPKQPDINKSIQDLFIDAWDGLNSIIEKSIRLTRNDFSNSNVTIPNIRSVNFTPYVLEISTLIPLNKFKFRGSPGKVEFSLKTLRNLNVLQILNKVAQELGKLFWKGLFHDSQGFVAARKEWLESLRNNIPDVQLRQEVYSSFNGYFADNLGVKLVSSGKQISSAKKSRVSKAIECPVFPVSDGKGYTVIGSYRYGRDVDIDPDGVWGSLSKQDPLQVLDKQTMEDVVNTYALGRNTGSAFKDQLEKKVLEQLRSSFSENDLIDLGLLKRTEGNLLEFSLSNWFETSREGVSKIPLVNAAYSLADIKGPLGNNFCSCKASEASVVLNIAGEFEYLDISNDVITPVLQDQSLSRSANHIQRQKALRGDINPVYEPIIATTVNNFNDIDDTFDAALANFNSAFDQFNDN